MKYHVNQECKMAERKGHTTKAAKLMLNEIKYNIDKIPNYQHKYQLLAAFFLPFTYILSMDKVTKDVFSELKKSRDKLRTTISNLPPYY